MKAIQIEAFANPTRSRQSRRYPRCRCAFTRRSGDRGGSLADQSLRSFDDLWRLWLSAEAAGHHGNGRSRASCRGGRGQKERFQWETNIKR